DVSFIFVSGYGANLKITKVTGLANVAGTALDASDMLFFNQTANSNKTVSTVIVTAAFSGATTAKTLYISSGTAYIGTNADGYQYNVYLDGVKTTVTAKNSDVSAIDGNFVNYTIDGNGIYEFGTAI